ncbi:brahma-associated protein of 60 kDa-like [Maniola jurtina]|uniref:brahma-associated protein of 60 kDa-like n=1 Tax=Maniola jurtina TaxID=191418 RepID=UPI001E68F791|nr:brahma-associated protein of 60 kDa-like [Maniola jurtina]
MKLAEVPARLGALLHAPDPIVINHLISVEPPHDAKQTACYDIDVEVGTARRGGGASMKLAEVPARLGALLHAPDPIVINHLISVEPPHDAKQTACYDIDVEVGTARRGGGASMKLAEVPARLGALLHAPDPIVINHLISVEPPHDAKQTACYDIDVEVGTARRGGGASMKLAEVPARLGALLHAPDPIVINHLISVEPPHDAKQTACYDIDVEVGTARRGGGASMKLAEVPARLGALLHAPDPIVINHLISVEPPHDAKQTACYDIDVEVGTARRGGGASMKLAEVPARLGALLHAPDPIVINHLISVEPPHDAKQTACYDIDVEVGTARRGGGASMKLAEVPARLGALLHAPDPIVINHLISVEPPHDAKQTACYDIDVEVGTARRGGGASMKLAEVPARLGALLHAPDPIVINHLISVEPPHDAKQTACYDIDVEVDDTLKTQMNNFLLSTANQQEIQGLDSKIHETVDTINQLKTNREFFLSFSKDPQQFIQKWLVSQSRDLKSMGSGAGGNPEEERLCALYAQPWAAEGAARYLHARLAARRHALDLALTPHHLPRV